MPIILVLLSFLRLNHLFQKGGLAFVWVWHEIKFQKYK